MRKIDQKLWNNVEKSVKIAKKHWIFGKNLTKMNSKCKEMIKNDEKMLKIEWK